MDYLLNKKRGCIETKAQHIPQSYALFTCIYFYRSLVILLSHKNIDSTGGRIVAHYLTSKDGLYTFLCQSPLHQMCLDGIVARYQFTSTHIPTLFLS
jgi:hypothetical protein